MDARKEPVRHHLLESSIDLVLWAIARRTSITARDVAAHFPVHRATAYRWARVLEDARVRAQFIDVPRAAPTRAPVRHVEARPQ